MATNTVTISTKRCDGRPPGSKLVHPCEKVIGIFFRHEFFTIYFSLFVLVFTHDIYEVVNNNSFDFC